MEVIDRSIHASLLTFSVMCRGCGQYATKLLQKEADKLRQLESPEGLEVVGLCAYECRNCQVVIFEDELIGGEKFVPYDFRPLSISPDYTPSPSQAELSFGTSQIAGWFGKSPTALV